MANFLSNIKIKTAVEKTHKHVFSASHDTSANFGQFNIMQKKWLVPGEGKINMYTFSNMQPMPQPTFGKVRYTNRLFFVPFRTIWKQFNDWEMDNIHTFADLQSGEADTMPYITMKDIVETMYGLMTPGTSTDYDVKYDINGTVQYVKHNDLSLWAKKFMHSLGMKWFYTNSLQRRINIMNLLAAIRIYVDYYYNNAYINDSDYLTLKEIVNYDSSSQNPLQLTKAQLTTILTLLHNVFYTSNLFVSAWENPNHPNIAGQESSFTFTDPNGNYNRTATGGQNYLTKTDITNDNAGTKKDPYITAEYGDITNTWIENITTWAINTLSALTRFLKRNQLAGGNTLTRYLTRLGVELPGEKMNKCIYLGKIEWGMNVSPIFSNADTASTGGDKLGSYAGSAYARSDDNKWIDLKTNDYGILMAINTVIPKEIYSQGIDRECLALTKSEIWTPEFDNIGVDAIYKGELIMPTSQGQTVDNNALLQQSFGFLPRYYMFKTMKDMVTGNYEDPRYQATFMPYLMQRFISPSTAISNLVHSKDFTKMTDADQYNRIYYAQSNDKQPYDNINLHHEMTIEWYCKMKPMYDYFDWEHEDGWEVEVQNNGATMN